MPATDDVTGDVISDVISDATDDATAEATLPTGRPVVLVTGGGKRLGRHIALHLARHGNDVAVHYRHSGDDAASAVAEALALGVDAAAFAADLADEAQCRALVPRVLARFHRLDAVVNNASTFEYDSADSFGHAAMERHWRANTAPAVLLAQALHDHLHIGPRRGCVVNITDQKLCNLNPDYFSYTLSKAALQAATVMLAQALAPQVRVCALAPGVTLPSSKLSGAEFTRAHGMAPLQRSSLPEDVAEAVRYLLGASAVTGSTLLVDGGQHLQALPRDVAFLTHRSGPMA